ncbi:MAG TPA: hypothetical protein VEB60_01395 [Candidatus Paceibacterota bacterium]|nr:hypothetical protein [Candidatus Paceibacterota bacterium]
MNSVNRLFFWLGPVIIVAAAALLLWQPYLHTRIYEDFNYHLLVAQNFERAGGPVGWAFWESYPEGRPQNYPPLLHLLLVPLVKTGIDPYLLTLYVPPFFVALALSLAWIGLKLLFDARTALFYLLISIGFERHFTQLGVTIPSSLVLAASPLLLYLVKNDRRIAAALLSALMLYTHMIMPYLVMASLFAWAVIDRRHIKTAALSIGGALLLYLPWGINLFLNRKYVKYLDPVYQAAKRADYLTLPLLCYLFFLAAFAYFFFRARKEKTRTAGWFFVLLFIAQTPMLFYKFPGRFTVAGGFFAGAIVAAYVLGLIWRNRPDAHALKAAIILFLLAGQYATLVLTVPLAADAPAILFWQRGALIQAQALSERGITDLSYPYQPHNLNIAKTIRENTAPDDMIYTASRFFNLGLHSKETRHSIGDFFAALSGRAKADPRLPEAYWLPEPPLEKLKIVIADYHETNLFPGKRETHPNPELAAKLEQHFDLLHQEDRLAVFINKSNETLKVQPSKPAINQWAAWLAIVGAATAVARETRAASREKQDQAASPEPRTERKRILS